MGYFFFQLLYFGHAVVRADDFVPEFGKTDRQCAPEIPQSQNNVFHTNRSFLKKYFFLWVFITSVLDVADQRNQQGEQSDTAYEHTSDDNGLTRGAKLWSDASAEAAGCVGRKAFKGNGKQPQVSVRDG